MNAGFDEALAAGRGWDAIRAFVASHGVLRHADHLEALKKLGTTFGEWYPLEGHGTEEDARKFRELVGDAQNSQGWYEGFPAITEDPGPLERTGAALFPLEPLGEGLIPLVREFRARGRSGRSFEAVPSLKEAVEAAYARAKEIDTRVADICPDDWFLYPDVKSNGDIAQGSVALAAFVAYLSAASDRPVPRKWAFSGCLKNDEFEVETKSVGAKVQSLRLERRRVSRAFFPGYTSNRVLDGILVASVSDPGGVVAEVFPDQRPEWVDSVASHAERDALPHWWKPGRLELDAFTCIWSRSEEREHRGLTELDFGERLYGRKDAIAEIVSCVKPGARVMLFGPSGAGKTSLVRAGVIPTLVAAGRTVLYISDYRHWRQLSRFLALAAACSDPPVLVLDQLEQVFSLEVSEPNRESVAAWLYGASGDTPDDRRPTLMGLVRSDCQPVLDRAQALREGGPSWRLKALRSLTQEDVVESLRPLLGARDDLEQLAASLCGVLLLDENARGAAFVLRLVLERLHSVSAGEVATLFTPESVRHLLGEHVTEVLGSIPRRKAREQATWLLKALCTPDGRCQWRTTDDLVEQAGVDGQRLGQWELKELLAALKRLVQSRGGEDSAEHSLVHDRLAEYVTTLASKKEWRKALAINALRLGVASLRRRKPSAPPSLWDLLAVEWLRPSDLWRVWRSRVLREEDCCVSRADRPAVVRWLIVCALISGAVWCLALSAVVGLASWTGSTLVTERAVAVAMQADAIMGKDPLAAARKLQWALSWSNDPRIETTARKWLARRASRRLLVEGAHCGSSWSSDGRLLADCWAGYAAEGKASLITLWNTDTWSGQPLLFARGLSQVSLSPDGQSLAGRVNLLGSAVDPRDPLGSQYLWVAHRTVRGSGDAGRSGDWKEAAFQQFTHVSTLAWHPNDGTLAVASEEGLRIVSPKTLQVLAEWPVDGIEHISFAPKGHRLAALSRHELVLLQADSEVERRPLPRDRRFVAVHWIDDESYCVGAEDGSLWRASLPSANLALLRPGTAAPGLATFGFAGTVGAVAQLGRVEFLSLASGMTFAEPMQGESSSRARAIVASPDRSRFVFADSGRGTLVLEPRATSLTSVRVRGLPVSGPEHEWAMHDEVGPTWTPAGDLVAFATYQQVKPRDVRRGHGERSLATIWVGSELEAERFNCRLDFHPAETSIRTVAWSPEGRRLAVGLDNEVRVFAVKIEGCSPVGSVRRAGAWLRLAWSRDGRFLVAANDAGEVVTWKDDQLAGLPDVAVAPSFSAVSLDPIGENGLYRMKGSSEVRLLAIHKGAHRGLTGVRTGMGPARWFQDRRVAFLTQDWDHLRVAVCGRRSAACRVGDISHWSGRDGPWSMDWNPDGSLLAVSTGEALLVLDSASVSARGVVQLPPSMGRNVRWHPSKRLVYLSDNRSLFAVDYPTRKEIEATLWRYVSEADEFFKQSVKPLRHHPAPALLRPQ